MKYVLWFALTSLFIPCWGATVNSSYALDNGSVISSPAEEKELPLMSVFKLHLACAVLDKMQRDGISFDHQVTIDPVAWELDTWSPLRKLYRGHEVPLSLRELLSASVRLSDNITTDILIDYLGGMPVLQARMKSWGIDCTLLHDEQKMHDEPECCRENLSSPAAVVELMRCLHEGRLLKEEHQLFLLNEMIACETGKVKIRALLPSELVIGDKTGSAPRDGEGLKCADNDAAFIRLPDGRVLYMAIFITDSALSDEENAALIAQRAREIYEKIEKSPRESRVE